MHLGLCVAFLAEFLLELIDHAAPKLMRSAHADELALVLGACAPVLLTQKRCKMTPYFALNDHFLAHFN